MHTQSTVNEFIMTKPQLKVKSVLELLIKSHNVHKLQISILKFQFVCLLT
ncbi:hypothetical protein EXN66_Car001369 [Channa argus]|uniref:Uncharacterized protein n=1 Tax=Channa argus TaxID=215402 RepID=A0A6G1R090_CHAAH|nr:hypothetical protein EXN66_Car001369 [Channa argus]